MHAGKWVAAVLLSVLTGPVSPVLAQSLQDLIQVNKTAGFATGLVPTDAARYEALPEAPRTRSAIPPCGRSSGSRRRSGSWGSPHRPPAG